MKIRRVQVFLFIVILMGSSFAFAGEEIKKEEIFYSKDKNYDYKAEKTITESGRKYRLKDVKYEVIIPSSEFVKRVKFKSLKERRVPENKDFEIGGETARLYLIEDKTQFRKKQKKIKKVYVYKRRNPFSFKPDQTRNFRNRDGTINVGKLKEVSKGNVYKENINIPGKFNGDRDAKYFYFSNSDTLWPINTDAPKWQGYEKDILTYLGLNASSYGITGGKWISKDISLNGNMERKAVFFGTKNVCDYTCTYLAKDISSQDKYSATAVYSANKVKAIMTYEPYKSLAEKVLIGIGLAVLAITVAAILFWILKRKNEDETE